MGTTEDHLKLFLREFCFARYLGGASLVIVVAVLSACAQSAEIKPKPTSDSAKTLENEIPGFLKSTDTPGAAVVMLDEGEIVLDRGFGFADLESKRAVDSKSIFNLASISKPITAWGVMRLVEKGKIDLDAPVEKYLKRWKFQNSDFDKNGVTVRRLLSHTAGINMPSIPGFPPGSELPTLEQTLKGEYKGSIYAKPGTSVQIAKKPGSAFSYSGGGFVLMQLLIEEVSGKAFDEFMREEVLRPLGMNSSEYGWFESPNNATPYTRSGNRERIFRFSGTAGAGVYATAGDLAKFVRANFYRKGNEVLKPGSVKLMHRRVIDTKGAEGPFDGFGLGFGLGRNGDSTLIGHSGGNAGWRCIFVALPETGKGIVLLTNSDNGDSFLRKTLCRWSELEFGSMPGGCGDH